MTCVPRLCRRRMSTHELHGEKASARLQEYVTAPLSGRLLHGLD